VPHHVGIMLAGEYITGSAHVGSKLVHLVVGLAAKHIAHLVWITQVRAQEVVGIDVGKLGKLAIGAANPAAVTLEPPHQMVTDESTGSANEDTSRHSDAVLRLA